MNVLIVDDMETNRRLLKYLLDSEGVTVFSARDGIDALKVLEEEKVDAVISDILMPRMDGYRLCAEMRKNEKFRRIPFIAYTSTYTSPSDEKTALDFGADVFLRKPSPAMKIIEALHEAIKTAPQRRATAIASPVVQDDAMQQYNASLITKLEHKNAQLEMQTAAMLKVQDQLHLQREALEAAANAILITDSGGAIRWVNAAFAALTGYTAEDCLGENPRFLKSDEHDATFYANLWQTILEGRTWQGEITNRRKDGTIFFAEQTITPIRLDGGPVTHFIGIMSDITSRKRLEAQFIGAQKMEVVGHLAGGVAHDFNNILGVIMGYSDLLIMKLAEEEELRGFVETIRTAAERAAGLTRQLLIFSRNQKVQLVVLNINEVIKELEKMLRRLIDEHIQLNIVPGEDAGRIRADSGYIGQVVMNLVVNARDAMPEGGLLTVTTGNATLDEAYAGAHAGSVPGEYVMLSVSDTGTGMTEEVRARIFEAFFTTKPKGKGTGLGLATCQTIVQQSGGYIEVQSEIGKGTTFKVYFPRVDQPLDVSAKAKTGPAPRGTETLLVVEDEASLRHLAQNVLKAQGYEVLTSANGQDALNLVRDHKGSPIRLVITDVIMPVMGGVVMAEWLKSDNPDMKILFTSGYTDDAITQHGVLEQGVEFLSKPYTPATLASKVREMLDTP